MNALTRIDRRTGIWRLVAVALLPILVLGLLLAALWNPVERLDTVRAAIVNLDEPVTVDGQLVPLGRQLAAGLVTGAAPSTEQTLKAAPATDAGYQWQITNAETARAGLRDGTFAAVVTIPEDFSAAATSFGGDAASARQATIDVATPPGGRVADAVIARYVASTATAVMGSSLTETYVDNVLVGFTTMSDQLGQAADGASQLAGGATSAADGAAQLADGAGQLADGAASAADGAGRLADGAQQAATGASGLASGARQLASGAEQLAGGAGQVADGITQSKTGADQLATGAGTLKDSLVSAGAGARTAAESIAAASQGVAGYASAIQGLADSLPQLMQSLGCPGSGAPQCDSLRALQGGLTAIVQGDPADPAAQPGLARIAAGLAAGAGTPSDSPQDGASLYALANGLDNPDDPAAVTAAVGAGQLQSGAQGLASGLGQLAGGAGQVRSGAEGLRTGAQQLASGASSLRGGIDQVASGTSDLAAGIGELAGGADGVASGAGDLADGVGQLADGAGEISDGLGQAVDGLPTYSDEERATLSSVIAAPVKAPGDDTLDTGSTGPLFAVVALWLGALGLTTVVRPSRARVLGATRGALRLALADLAVPATVAAVTGVAVGGILAAVEHLSVGGWFGAIGLGALASVVFVVLHQGFTLLLGDIARGASLLMAVLVIATGVVATVPQWLTGIADFLAIGAARRALVGLVVPGADGLGPAVTSLVVWGLAGVALAVLMTARARTVRVSRLLAAA